jgi:hypothetical protein
LEVLRLTGAVVDRPARGADAVVGAALAVLLAWLADALAGVGSDLRRAKRQRPDRESAGEAAQGLASRPGLAETPDEAIKW